MNTNLDSTKAMKRSGGSLIISTGVLTVSGFAFWLVVGRYLDDQSLGRVVALTSLILFLSGVTRLNMAASLPAILTGAGRSGRRILLKAYQVAAIIGLGVSLLISAWSWFTGSDIGGPAWLLPVYVVTWSVFSMQDGALVAAGDSTAVAIENTAYSVLRLAAAFVALSIAPTLSSALIAWFLPLLIIIPIVNRRLWSRFTGPPAQQWNPEGFGRLVAADFFGSVAILASTRGFAYLALVLLPADSGAELAVAWLFFITVDVAFAQASNALARESTWSPDARNRLAHSAVNLALPIGVLGGIIGILVSPLLLGFLLEDPSSEVVTALRFIFVALTARPIIHVWLADARAIRDHSRLTVGPVLALGLLILAVTPGFVANNIVMVAAGVAISQWLVAIAAFVDLRLDELSAWLKGSRFERLSDLHPDNRTLPNVVTTRSKVVTAPGPDLTPSNRRIATEPADFDRPIPRSATEIAPSETRTFSPDELQTSGETDRWTTLAIASSVVSVVLFVIAVRFVDYDQIDGLGLLRALPAVFWMSVACTTLGFAVFVAKRHRIGAAFSVAMLTVSLHGIEPITAPVARFSVAWLLSGFSELIAQTGTTQRLIDARFSWPGFFLGPAAGLSGDQEAISMAEVGIVAGLDKGLDVEPLIRFWPLGVMAVWVLVVWAMTRHWFPNRWSAAPLAAWLFSLFAWTGQDYFSPQSMGVTLTAIIVLLIILFDPDVPGDIPWKKRLMASITIGGRRDRNPAITAFILILVMAIVVSHPLSPVFLVLWLIPLAAAGYRYARGLPLLVFVGFLTWVSGAARPWWSSRIASLVGNVGAVGSTVSDSTTARAAEASVDRSLVLLSRAQIIVLAAEFTVVAAFYLWRFQRSRAALLMVGLAALPGLAIIGQPYGGEIIVRVFLFSVFPASIVVGAALACVRSRTLLIGAVVAVTLIGAPALIINRYGNESFEMTTLSDHQALAAMYEQSPADTLFVTDDPFISWGYTRFQRVDKSRNHQYLRRLVPDETTVERAVEAARESGFDYVAIVTADSQEAWGENTVGRPEGWLISVSEFLEEHPNVTTLYRSGTSGAFLMDVDDFEEPTR